MSEQSSPDVTVRNAPQEGRFEIHVDGKLAGVAEYTEETGHRTFVHTEVDDAFSGQGLAGVLVRAALDTTREDGLRIRATCPYVQRFLEKNDDWADLVDTAEDAS
ncbi:GNAT family N-acetyltransferase [Sporichthya polymorpha]|uniref:GNAT family N-acetyltransferase n=1 Tax=Sporichthya polymorpha TaxID=35751 RepID=UPI0003815ECB|nr:GNAT family N-acetyltransferase [Sporichthya polymorpha]